MPKMNVNQEIKIPEVSNTYKANKAEIEYLETDTRKLIDEAAKQMEEITKPKSVMKNESYNSDIYLTAVKQGLTELPQDLIFHTVCGILDIIDNFSTENK